MNYLGPLVSVSSTNPHSGFVLDTYASGWSIGAVISQKQNGEQKVIAYFSPTLNQAGHKYCGTRKELFAIVKGVNHFYTYLYGYHFLFCTNHASLKWLLSLHHLKEQVVHWLVRLQEYHFTTEHLAGLKHKECTCTVQTTLFETCLPSL